MELEDMIKAYLEQALKNEQAPADPALSVQKAEPQPEYLTKGDLDSILQGFASTIVDGVQKALPVIEREPGAGRRGLSNEGQGEPDQLGLIVQKAQETPEKLSNEEKELVYRLSYEYMTAGLAR